MSAGLGDRRGLGVLRQCLGGEETDKSLNNFGDKGERGRAVGGSGPGIKRGIEEIKASLKGEEASQEREK